MLNFLLGFFNVNEDIKCSILWKVGINPTAKIPFLKSTSCLQQKTVKIHLKYYVELLYLYSDCTGFGTGAKRTAPEVMEIIIVNTITISFILTLTRILNNISFKRSSAPFCLDSTPDFGHYFKQYQIKLQRRLQKRNISPKMFHMAISKLNTKCLIFWSIFERPREMFTV